MTRFARASGSKGSNERVPEEATSWSEMKQQLMKSKLNQTNKETVGKQQNFHVSKKPMPSLNVSPKSTVWAEFDAENSTLLSSKSSLSPENNKSLKNKVVGKVQNNSKIIVGGIEEEVDDDQKTFTSKLTFESLKNKRRLTDSKSSDLQNQKKIKCTDDSKETELKHNDWSPKSKKANKKKGNAVQSKDKANVGYVGGFAVKKEDANRINQLKKNMIAKGASKQEAAAAVLQERRRAEKKLARENNTLCFNCRKRGHQVASCPENKGPNDICFKCGSTEHMLKNCRVKNSVLKFASCFICKEQGHLSKQCPDNPRGLYPKGGGCNVCGDVTHMKSECPELVSKKSENCITLKTVDNKSIEGLDEESIEVKNTCNVKKPVVVKF